MAVSKILINIFSSLDPRPNLQGRVWGKTLPGVSWALECCCKCWWGNEHHFSLVSHGQTLFRTEGKGLGLDHRATCRPAPWSAYQSQRSIQSHDTWSMWLTGNSKFQLEQRVDFEVWEVNRVRSVLSHELNTIKIEIVSADSPQVLFWQLLSLDYMTNWIPGQHTLFLVA